MSPLYTTWKTGDEKVKGEECIGHEDLEERMIEG
jgi:hypothetical protein